MDPPPDHPPRARRASEIVLIAAAIGAVWIAAATAAGIHHEFSSQLEKDTSHLQAIAEFKSAQIGERLAERRADAEFVRTSSFFAAQYQLWRDAGDAHALDTLRSRLEEYRDNPGTEAISLLDADARPLWQSAAAPRSVSRELRAALAAAAATGSVRTSVPYLDADGSGRLDLVAPLTLAGRAPPFVVLHVGLNSWLFASLQSMPVRIRSTEIGLLRRDGPDVLVLNNLPRRQQAGLRQRIAASDPELLAARILRGEVESGEVAAGRDYAGLPVIGAFRRVPGTDWWLVAKMDRAEVFADAVPGMVSIGTLGLLALLMTAAGAYLLRQQQRLAVASELQRAQTQRLHELHAVEETLRSQAEELRNRNAELERFNRAMVGRELDMIALKRQVNDLSLKLRKDPPFDLGFAAEPDRAASESRAQCR